MEGLLPIIITFLIPLAILIGIAESRRRKAVDEHLTTSKEDYEKSPFYLLQTRFAKGEISKEEYEEMKQVLKGENSQ